MLAFVRTVERADNVKKNLKCLLNFKIRQFFPSKCLISSELLKIEINSFNQGRIFLNAWKLK